MVQSLGALVEDSGSIHPVIPAQRELMTSGLHRHQACIYVVSARTDTHTCTH